MANNASDFLSKKEHLAALGLRCAGTVAEVVNRWRLRRRRIPIVSGDDHTKTCAHSSHSFINGDRYMTFRRRGRPPWKNASLNSKYTAKNYPQNLNESGSEVILNKILTQDEQNGCNLGKNTQNNLHSVRKVKDEKVLLGNFNTDFQDLSSNPKSKCVLSESIQKESCDSVDSASMESLNRKNRSACPISLLRQSKRLSRHDLASRTSSAIQENLTTSLQKHSENTTFQLSVSEPISHQNNNRGLAKRGRKPWKHLSLSRPVCFSSKLQATLDKTENKILPEFSSELSMENQDTKPFNNAAENTLFNLDVLATSDNFVNSVTKSHKPIGRKFIEQTESVSGLCCHSVIDLDRNANNIIKQELSQGRRPWKHLALKKPEQLINEGGSNVLISGQSNHQCDVPFEISTKKLRCKNKSCLNAADNHNLLKSSASLNYRTRKRDLAILDCDECSALRTRNVKKRCLEMPVKQKNTCVSKNLCDNQTSLLCSTRVNENLSANSNIPCCVGQMPISQSHKQFNRNENQFSNNEQPISKTHNDECHTSSKNDEQCIDLSKSEILLETCKNAKQNLFNFVVDSNSNAGVSIKKQVKRGRPPKIARFVKEINLKKEEVSNSDVCNSKDKNSEENIANLSFLSPEKSVKLCSLESNTVKLEKKLSDLNTNKKTKNVIKSFKTTSMSPLKFSTRSSDKGRRSFHNVSNIRFIALPNHKKQSLIMSYCKPARYLRNASCAKNAVGHNSKEKARRGRKPYKHLVSNKIVKSSVAETLNYDNLSVIKSANISACPTYSTALGKKSLNFGKNNLICEKIQPLMTELLAEGLLDNMNSNADGKTSKPYFSNIFVDKLSSGTYNDMINDNNVDKCIPRAALGHSSVVNMSNEPMNMNSKDNMVSETKDYGYGTESQLTALKKQKAKWLRQNVWLRKKHRKYRKKIYPDEKVVLSNVGPSDNNVISSTVINKEQGDQCNNLCMKCSKKKSARANCSCNKDGKCQNLNNAANLVAQAATDVNVKPVTCINRKYRKQIFPSQVQIGYQLRRNESIIKEANITMPDCKQNTLAYKDVTCKPCKVVLVDFIKCINLKQKNTFSGSLSLPTNHLKETLFKIAPVSETSATSLTENNETKAKLPEKTSDLCPEMMKASFVKKLDVSSRIIRDNNLKRMKKIVKNSQQNKFKKVKARNQRTVSDQRKSLREKYRPLRIADVQNITGKRSYVKKQFKKTVGQKVRNRHFLKTQNIAKIICDTRSGLEENELKRPYVKKHIGKEMSTNTLLNFGEKKTKRAHVKKQTKVDEVSLEKTVKRPYVKKQVNNEISCSSVTSCKENNVKRPYVRKQISNKMLCHNFTSFGKNKLKKPYVRKQMHNKISLESDKNNIHREIESSNNKADMCTAYNDISSLNTTLRLKKIKSGNFKVIKNVQTDKADNCSKSLKGKMTNVGKIVSQNFSAEKGKTVLPNSVEILPGGIKMYECLHCNFHTKFRSSMINHVYLHTKIIPYSCGYCGSKFGSKSGVYVHTKRDHPNQPVQLMHVEHINEESHFCIRLDETCIQQTLSLNDLQAKAIDNDLSEVLNMPSSKYTGQASVVPMQPNNQLIINETCKTADSPSSSVLYKVAVDTLSKVNLAESPSDKSIFNLDQLSLENNSTQHSQNLNSKITFSSLKNEESLNGAHDVCQVRDVSEMLILGYYCLLCTFNSDSSISIEKHIKQCHDGSERYTCSVCLNFTASTADEARLHLCQAHPNTIVEIVPDKLYCSVCKSSDTVINQSLQSNVVVVNYCNPNILNDVTVGYSDPKVINDTAINHSDSEVNIVNSDKQDKFENDVVSFGNPKKMDGSFAEFGTKTVGCNNINKIIVNLVGLNDCEEDVVKCSVTAKSSFFDKNEFESNAEDSRNFKQAAISSAAFENETVSYCNPKEIKGGLVEEEFENYALGCSNIEEVENGLIGISNVRKDENKVNRCSNVREDENDGIDSSNTRCIENDVIDSSNREIESGVIIKSSNLREVENDINENEDITNNDSLSTCSTFEGTSISPALPDFVALGIAFDNNKVGDECNIENSCTESESHADLFDDTDDVATKQNVKELSTDVTVDKDIRLSTDIASDRDVESSTSVASVKDVESSINVASDKDVKKSNIHVASDNNFEELNANIASDKDVEVLSIDAASNGDVKNLSGDVALDKDVELSINIASGNDVDELSFMKKLSNDIQHSSTLEDGIAHADKPVGNLPLSEIAPNVIPVSESSANCFKLSGNDLPLQEGPTKHTHHSKVLSSILSVSGEPVEDNFHLSEGVTGDSLFIERDAENLHYTNLHLIEKDNGNLERTEGGLTDLPLSEKGAENLHLANRHAKGSLLREKDTEGRAEYSGNLEAGGSDKPNSLHKVDDLTVTDRAVPMTAACVSENLSTLNESLLQQLLTGNLTFNDITEDRPLQAFDSPKVDGNTQNSSVVLSALEKLRRVCHLIESAKMSKAVPEQSVVCNMSVSNNAPQPSLICNKISNLDDQLQISTASTVLCSNIVPQLPSDCNSSAANAALDDANPDDQDDVVVVSVHFPKSRSSLTSSNAENHRNNLPQFVNHANLATRSDNALNMSSRVSNINEHEPLSGIRIENVCSLVNEKEQSVWPDACEESEVADKLRLKFVCKICDEEFSCKLNIVTHVGTAHDIKQLFLCTHCSAFISGTVSDVIRHLCSIHRVSDISEMIDNHFKVVSETLWKEVLFQPKVAQTARRNAWPPSETLSSKHDDFSPKDVKMQRKTLNAIVDQLVEQKKQRPASLPYNSDIQLIDKQYMATKNKEMRSSVGFSSSLSMRSQIHGPSTVVSNTPYVKSKMHGPAAVIANISSDTLSSSLSTFSKIQNSSRNANIMTAAQTQRGRFLNVVENPSVVTPVISANPRQPHTPQSDSELFANYHFKKQTTSAPLLNNSNPYEQNKNKFDKNNVAHNQLPATMRHASVKSSAPLNTHPLVSSVDANFISSAARLSRLQNEPLMKQPVTQRLPGCGSLVAQTPICYSGLPLPKNQHHTANISCVEENFGEDNIPREAFEVFNIEPQVEPTFFLHNSADGRISDFVPVAVENNKSRHLTNYSYQESLSPNIQLNMTGHMSHYKGQMSSNNLNRQVSYNNLCHLSSTNERMLSSNQSRMSSNNLNKQLSSNNVNQLLSDNLSMRVSSSSTGQRVSYSNLNQRLSTDNLNQPMSLFRMNQQESLNSLFSSNTPNSRISSSPMNSHSNAMRRPPGMFICPYCPKNQQQAFFYEDFVLHFASQHPQMPIKYIRR